MLVHPYNPQFFHLYHNLDSKDIKCNADQIFILISVVSDPMIFDFLHRILISTNAMQTRLGTAAPELLHFPNLTQWLKVVNDEWR